MRLLVLAVLASSLIVADARYQLLDGLRASLGAASTPFYWLTQSPARLLDWLAGAERPGESPAQENARLKQEALILRGRVLQMSALAAENGRLRELLNSSARLKSDDVIIAEIIGISPMSNRHNVVVDKGARDGVSVGQPVIDAAGLVGQVVEVNALSARIMLIADSLHSVPVQVIRSGMRSVAEGGGRLDELQLRHVTPTSDIKPGDMLVTSGLGGRFPSNYPVARVTSIIDDPGQPFLTVRAAPTASLAQIRHVLLVFSGHLPVGDAAL